MDWAVTAKLSAMNGMAAGFARATTGVESFARRAASAFGLANREGGLFRKLVGANIVSNLATRGIRMLTSEIRNLVSGGLELASNLVEVQNVVNTTFGTNAGAIDRWARGAMTAFGVSELQAKQYTGTLGAMLKSSGLTGDAIVEMSTGLSGLVGDFASFYNLEHDVAFQKIRSGISGETEPLKQLGVNMSVANMQAFALTQGIRRQWQQMGQAEQATLRYKYLMTTTADAQGDFAKTLETSYANQRRVLSSNIEAVAARAMSAALPVALRLTTRLNGIVERVGEWVAANQELIATKIETFVNGVVEKLRAMGRWYTDNKAQIAAVWNGVTGAMRWIGDNWKLVLGGVAAWKAVTIAINVAKAAKIAFALVPGPAAAAVATGGAAAAGGLGPAALRMMGGGAAVAGGGASMAALSAIPVVGAALAMLPTVARGVVDPAGTIERAKRREGGILDRITGIGIRAGLRLRGESTEPAAPNAYAAAVQQRQADSMQSVLEGNVNFSVNTQATPGVGVQIRRAPPVTSPTLRQYQGGR